MVETALQPGKATPVVVGQAEVAPSGLAGILSGLVVVDLLIGFLLLWDRYPIPGLGQPAGIAVLLTAIGLATLRRPTHHLRHKYLIVGLYGFMVIWAVAVTELNGLEWHQRAAKMVILLVFALVIATGRLHVKSLLVGLTAALVINIPLYYAGLTPDRYPPFLTGFLGDKNVAGLMYATMMFAGLAAYRSRRAMVAHVVVMGIALFLTGSRTSMSGAALGLVWLLLRNRLPVVGRLGLIAAMMWLLVFVEERFARLGIFSDREGTDWFRAQIQLATEAKLARSPWYGNGLTTAWVDVTPGRPFLFHSSYSSLRIEGGWVMVAVMLFLAVVLAGGLYATSRVTTTIAIGEAAIAAVLVCAWQLGEVFFTTPTFLVLGILWRLRLGLVLNRGSVSFPCDVNSEGSAGPEAT